MRNRQGLDFTNLFFSTTPAGKEEIKMKRKKEKRQGAVMDRRAFLKTATMLGTTVAAGGFPAIIHAQSKKEIVIGAISPQSGGMASIGQHEKNSFEMVIEEVNAAGGIKSMGGAKLKAVTGNDEGKPEAGMAEAERLIRAGAIALIGCDLSHVTYATTAVAEKHKVCHLVPMSVADNITERGFKYTFRTTDRTKDHGFRFMRFLKALEKSSGVDIKTAVVMHVDTLFGKSVADTTVNAAKVTGTITILEDIPYPENPRDLSSEITKAKAHKPDILMLASYLPDCILIANTMYEQKFEVKGVMGISSNHIVPEFIQAVGKRAEYVMTATISHNALGKRWQTLNKKYMSRYGKPAAVHGASFYEAALVIVDALERAGSADPEKLRVSLTKTNFFSDLITREGTIYFDETGQCPSNVRALIQIIGGKYYCINPPMYAERDPVFPVPKS